MKRIVCIVINFILLFNLPPFVFSDFGYRDRVEYHNKIKKQKTIQTQKREIAEGITTSGIISNINLVKNIFTLIDSNEKPLVILIPEVSIWKEGKETTVQTLKVNQKVKVTYYTFNQENSAQFIEILSD